MFWSAPVNDPANPLQLGANAESFGDRQFFSTDALGPEGTPWAGFHCALTTSCPGTRLGVVGSLSWPG